MIRNLCRSQVVHLYPVAVGGTPLGVVNRGELHVSIGNMITDHDIVRLRARATYFRREAAHARSRNSLIYCRALAAHLDREASELERDIRSNAPRGPETRSAIRT